MQIGAGLIRMSRMRINEDVMMMMLHIVYKLAQLKFFYFEELCFVADIFLLSDF